MEPPHFWTRNNAHAESLCSSASEQTDPLNIEQVHNAHVLPMRRTTLSKRSTYEGGVTDSHFNFIAGYFRRKNKYDVNKTCVRSYTPDDHIKYLDEDVVYGGVMFGHFGHIMTDGMSMLYALLEPVSKDKRVVFIREPGKATTDAFYRLLELLGKEPGEVLIIDHPHQFRSVYVPDQSLYFFESYHAKLRDMCQEIARSVYSPPPNGGTLPFQITP